MEGTRSHMVEVRLAAVMGLGVEGMDMRRGDWEGFPGAPLVVRRCALVGGYSGG